MDGNNRRTSVNRQKRISIICRVINTCVITRNTEGSTERRCKTAKMRYVVVKRRSWYGGMKGYRIRTYRDWKTAQVIDQTRKVKPNAAIFLADKNITIKKDVDH